MDYDDGGEEDQEKQYEVTFQGDPTTYSHIARDGVAKVAYVNGDIFEGEYKHGKRNGRGVYVYLSGTRYDGEYRDGKKDGRGRFSFPDGGVYEGEFKSDLRDGKGRYTYPNGEVYDGEWRRDQKHGFGTYTYATQAVLTGMWSHGQVMHGDLRHLDGTAFSGRFQGSVPQGQGLFSFPSGQVQAGSFDAAGAWVKDAFTAPGPKAKAPEPVQAKPFARAARLVDKCVFKSDQFENCQAIKKLVAGAPNLRQATGGAPIVGVGQPTLQGLTEAVDWVSSNVSSSIMWVSVRESPCAYVGDIPLHPRDRKHVGERLDLGIDELSTEELAQLDERFAARLQADIHWRGGEVQFFKESFAEDPVERKSVEQASRATDSVRSLQGTVDFLGEQGIQLDFVRAPLNSDGAPSAAQLDTLLERLRDTDANTAVVFCSRTGRARSTLGMAIAQVYNAALRGDEEEDPEDDDVDAGGDDDAEGGGGERKRQAKEPEYDPTKPNLNKAQYACVMKLVSLMPNGEKVKKDVDKAVDSCSEAENLRTVILALRDTYMKTSEDLRQPVWERAVLALQRYLSLFLVYLYVREQAPQDFAKPYSEWARGREVVDLTEEIGGPSEGPLSQFLWE